jgi:radical SAM superfamily enzyme YgiQ (UPF0313 family)
MITKVVILSVPYTEMVPAVAPALLSACLNDKGIPSIGIDLSIEFSYEFYKKPYWNKLKLFLAVGAVDENFNYFRALVDLLKFIKKKLISIKTKYNPSIIGLSIFTTESINFSYFLIPYIRKYLPDTQIMLGGRALESTCGVENKLHYQKYYDHGLADLIIVGDAEIQIIEAIKSNATGIQFAKQQTQDDLDNIPAPNWSGYNFNYYAELHNLEIATDHTRKFLNPKAMVITASKGCVRNCNFCDVKEYWPNYIFRRGENVANDIIKTYQETGISEFEFVDNLINGSVPNYRKMNLVLAEKIPRLIKYRGYAIFRDSQSMPESDFEIAAEAGCVQWSVGIESGSEKVRKNMRKNFSDDDLHYGVNQLYKNGIMQTWLLMVGYPSEDHQDFDQTMNLLKLYRTMNNKDMIQLHVSLPFQLNEVAPLLKDKKYIDQYKWDHEENNAYFRYFWTTPTNPDNTFEVRYHRYKKLIQLAIDLNYTFLYNIDVKKRLDELEDLKKIYDQNNKKVIYITNNK